MYGKDEASISYCFKVIAKVKVDKTDRQTGQNEYARGGIKSSSTAGQPVQNYLSPFKFINKL